MHKARRVEFANGVFRAECSCGYVGIGTTKNAADREAHAHQASWNAQEATKG